MTRASLLIFVLLALTSCLLTTSFGEYDTNPPDSGLKLYGVSGTVAGLQGGAQVSIVVNGDTAHALSVGNGPFTFPPLITDGATFSVGIQTAPSGYQCSVTNGSGTIAGADATGVLVQCVSTSASLTGLTISAGPLHEAFAPSTLMYTAGPILIRPFIAPSTSTTVTATAVPGATIKVAGADVASGVASQAIPLSASATVTIDVVVTAQDGTTKTQYSISVSGRSNDYFKPSRSSAMAFSNIAVSGDGQTIAVGATQESSNATGVDGDQTNTSQPYAGAVYVFVRSGQTWTQQAYIKASNTGHYNYFGGALALSNDGNTLAVGAYGESSTSTGINGSQTQASYGYSGATYVFTRSAGTWTQQAYVKASNTANYAYFGWSVALSGDGTLLAVGSFYESSNATGINGSQFNNFAPSSGAVYVFKYAGVWTQQTYIKASNTRSGAAFGYSVAFSRDGSTLVAGSPYENSNATGINGNQSDQSQFYAGAAYVFANLGSTWTQQAYVKASNTNFENELGNAVALSDDGNTLAVGSYGEQSSSTGVNGNQTPNSSYYFAGAAYVFARVSSIWTQQAYVKASNTAANYDFGNTIALAGDGNTLVVGSKQEGSGAVGINGDQTDNSEDNAGAAYAYTRSGPTWTQRSYIKASNTRYNSYFATSLGLSSDGLTLAIGAPGDRSNATGVNGDQSNASAKGSGAAYVFF
jgi:hypothetical protein